MNKKIEKSWQLIKIAYRLSLENKKLFFYPIIKAVVTVLMLAILIIPIGLWFVFSEPLSLDWTNYVIFGIAGLLLYFLLALINGAFYLATYKALCGEEISVRGTFKLAWVRRKPLFLMSVLNVGVGFVIGAINSQLNKHNENPNETNIVSGVFSGIAGFTWSLATYFSTQSIMDYGHNPLRALTHSYNIFKKTWGENIIGSTAFFLLFIVGLTLVGLPVLGINGVIYLINPNVNAIVFPIVYAILAVPYIVIALILATSAQEIFKTALYKHANTGDYIGPYTPEMISSAHK